MSRLPLNARTDAILRRLVRKEANQHVQKILAKTRNEDVAAAFSHLTGSERQRLFQLISNPDAAADVLTNLDEAAVNDVVTQLSNHELIDLLERMEPDDATDIIELLPEETRQAIMNEMRGEETEEVANLLHWPSDSAGGIMSPSVFKMPESATCGQAIRAVQERSEEYDSIFYVYLVDSSHRLVGVVSLRALLVHPPNTPLVSIMTRDVIGVDATTDQEEVARYVARYDLLAVPVVNEHGHLLGIVTVDDVVDVIREEAVEDMMLMAGVKEDPGPTERSLWYMVRSRFGWLLATIFGGILASELINFYEGTLLPPEKVAVLAGFIPVIMGMGGNVGIQSATITVRGLATGQVQLGGAFAFVVREARVGLVLGGLYGVLLGVYALARHMEDPVVGISVASSVTLAIIVASLFGTITPVALSRLEIDPAVATGPFVTTVVDILGIAIYLSIASALVL
jgi:magnesium transporter